MAVTLWACLVGGAGHDSSSGEAGRCSSVFPRGGESMVPLGPLPFANQGTLAQSAGASLPRTGPIPRPIFPQPGMQPQFGQQQQLPPWLQALMGGFQGMPSGGMPGGFGGWQGHPMPFQPGSQFGAPQQPGIFGQGFGAQQGGFGGGYGSMNPQMMHPMPVMPLRGSAASFY